MPATLENATPLSELLRKGASIPEIVKTMEEWLDRREAKRVLPLGYVQFTRRGIDHDLDWTRRLQRVLERVATHLEADDGA